MDSTDHHKANLNWFHIRYIDGAGDGLPPVLQAERIVRYADDTGTWLVGLWDNEPNADMNISACILRIPAEHVQSVSRHQDMVSAVNQMLFG